MSNPVGRPADIRRREYGERFNLSRHQWKYRLPVSLLDQLDRCHSDVERRLILRDLGQENAPVQMDTGANAVTK